MSRRRATPSPPIRHLVLDNEAAGALLSSRRKNPERAAVVLAIAAASGRRLVPTAVRAEAGWNRTTPRAANANRLLPRASADVTLDSPSADRAADLLELVPRASVVDATVAVAAELAGADGHVVEILTSDVPDLDDLGANLRATVDVVQL